MGMTACEKILARSAGLKSVKPGDVIHPRADWTFLHDLQVPATKKDLDALGIDRVANRDKVVFVTDHEVIYTSPAIVERGQKIRQTAAEWRIKNFFDVGQGGHGHIFPIEKGMVLPGDFIFANDMHCTNFGAIGAFGLRAGSEVSCVLATGTLWTLVPKTIRVTLTGQRRDGVYGRDVGFRLSRQLIDGTYNIDANYRVIELAGEALDQFDLGERVALCNTPTEVGVINVFVPPSRFVLERISAVAGRPFEAVYSDSDAEYEADILFDLSNLEPQIALPGSPENAVDISSVVGKRVNHAFIGSCGSGMYEDIVVAASYLAGRHVASGVRLFVVPGTPQSARRMVDEGLMSVFQEAGAIVMPSGCGPCNGGNMGPLGSMEVSISTAAVNTAGRMGAKDAAIYLGSPATVAASAIAGQITDPRAISRYFGGQNSTKRG
jgi:3-isopropylmalate/(R)-2-methylmalate dehydratase large subunit